MVFGAHNLDNNGFMGQISRVQYFSKAISQNKIKSLYNEGPMSDTHKYNISFVSLISPNTSIERVKKIDQISDGFLYVVSSSSITGKNNLFDLNQIKYFNSLNNILLKNPKIIGFGISDKKSFDIACNYSNGAIIGTKFINSLDALNLNKSIEKFVNSILL